MPDPTTELVISGIGVPPYSARGINQTLTPIAAATAIRRTVNGDADDLAATQFRKYASTISCDDQQAPAFASFWPGMTLTVECVAELGYKTSGGSPGRSVVSGSSRVEGDFTFFRPVLVMICTAFSAQADELGAAVSWSLTLEEV